MQLNISNGTRLSNFFEWFYLVYFYPSGFQCFNTYGQLKIKFWTDFVLYHGRRPWPTDFFISICNLLITTIFCVFEPTTFHNPLRFARKVIDLPDTDIVIFYRLNLIPRSFASGSLTAAVTVALIYGNIQLSSLFTIVISI